MLKPNFEKAGGLGIAPFVQIIIGRLLIMYIYIEIWDGYVT